MKLKVIWETRGRKLRATRMPFVQALSEARALSKTERRVAIVHNGELIYSGGQLTSAHFPIGD